MKSDSVYSPACLSFHTLSAQHVTFCSKLIIPAVIYIQCVHSWISQIIVINLTNAGDPPVWMCDGPAWTSSKLFHFVGDDKSRLYLLWWLCSTDFISWCFFMSIKNKTNHIYFEFLILGHLVQLSSPACCFEHTGHTMGCIDTRLYESLMNLFLPIFLMIKHIAKQAYWNTINANLGDWNANTVLHGEKSHPDSVYWKRGLPLFLF